MNLLNGYCRLSKERPPSDFRFAGESGLEKRDTEARRLFLSLIWLNLRRGRCDLSPQLWICFDFSVVYSRAISNDRSLYVFRQLLQRLLPLGFIFEFFPDLFL